MLEGRTVGVVSPAVVRLCFGDIDDFPWENEAVRLPVWSAPVPPSSELVPFSVGYGTERERVAGEMPDEVIDILVAELGA